jgi:dihydroxy-acid dehydratase
MSERATGAPGRRGAMAEKSKNKSNGDAKGGAKPPLRSRLWFDNPQNPGMTALYIERYLNFGLTPGELR